MAQNSRQRAIERKKKKRDRTREQKRAHVRARTGWPSSQAVRWPVLECLVSEHWGDGRSLATVIVARRRDGQGLIAMALFLMDLQCLGGKNGFAAMFDPSRYRSTCAAAMEAQGAVAVSLDLAAKIVREGIAYGRSLGFSPHADVVRALPMLHGACPEHCDERVPLGGPDGQPLYIEGPDDDAKRIIDTLDRRAGAPEYGFVRRADFEFGDDSPLPSPQTFR